MDKLIITCCTNDIGFWQGVKGLEHMPTTVREIADAIRDACNAGAAAVHPHAPVADKTKKIEAIGEPDTEGWLKLIQTVRQESDVIFEHGQSGFPYFLCEHRIPEIPASVRQQTFDLKAESPDMAAILLNFIHHEFGGPRGIYVMPTRDELEGWMRKCLDNNVKPAFEVWHIGDYNNLLYLEEKGLVKKPYWLTMFFGTKSGVGSPATVKELLHRVDNMPKDCLYQVSVWPGVKGSGNVQDQLSFFAQTIAMGGHIRLGMEDYPYYWDGVPAKNNAQLVERIVRMAREMGREIASPAEARQMLGLPPLKK